MKKVSNKQYAEALYEISKDLEGEELTKALQQFVAVLACNNKLKQGDNIIGEFEKYIKKQEGIVEIKIESARKLDEETLEEIKKVFGKKVEATTKTRKKILGGVRVKTGDRILDGSLKAQLTNLKQSLSK